jgi:RNA polymerase sigma-70 factor (ECF subfamily)
MALVVWRSLVQQSGEPGRIGEPPSVVASIRAGDESAFASLTEPYRRELVVHCYRMAGNLEEAEDLVQETLFRAWRARSTFQGRASLRAWLYRIATNVCLDAVKRSRRRPRVVGPLPDEGRAPSFDEVPWLQPLPDQLLEDVGAEGADPSAAVVAKETIELAFLAALQHLPPRQRAVLILRDVMDWSPGEIADALDGTVPAVNSALQRARARLQSLGQRGRLEWVPVTAPTDSERVLVQRYMDAHARADADAVIELLGEEVRFSMPPDMARFEGRAAVAGFFGELFGADNPGDWRLVATRANGQPAAANYVRRWGAAEYRAMTLDVLKVEHGRLIEITTFGANVFSAFELPLVLADADR